MTTIAIIGAGFSGTILALNLLECGIAGDRVVLIERRRDIALGQAYSTTDSQHLLNIRASNMSPLSAHPNAFVEFLARHRYLLPDGNASLPDCYAPRRLYGRFLKHLVEEKMAATSGRPQITRVQGTAVDISYDNGNKIILADGRTFRADRIVLALGNLPPKMPSDIDGFDEALSCYIGDPWAPDRFESLAPDATVLLLGTGLTMMDCALSLTTRRHRGRVIAISRHGLLPRRHEPVTVWPSFVAPSEAGSVGQLLRLVRRQIDRAKLEGQNWQSVLNSLRPFAQDLWTGFPETEQARFIRHVRPWWDVHRHRVAPAVADKIEAMIAVGQLHVMAGWIRKIRKTDAALDVVVKLRGTDATCALRVDHVVNCSGPNYDFSTSDEILLKRLVESGRIVPNVHRLGLRVADGFATLDRDGIESGDLFAMGPMLRGQYWEINAVPEIVVQAERLAAQLWHADGRDAIRAEATAIG